MNINLSLNDRAHRLCASLDQQADALRIAPHQLDCGTKVYDFGVQSLGGLRAGICLAEICLAGLANVNLESGDAEPTVRVFTDHPVAACMASQYAGWQISEGKFFAMGSGPMRSAAKREALIQRLGCGENATQPVGILEADRLPDDQVCEKLAAACGVTPPALSLCVAPTTSFAGCIQVVARSVETALHKMYELDFDLRRVVSGFGTAPLPPLAANQLAAIGRTNDAILYGSRVTLWVRGEDQQLESLVQQVPSQASRDHGVPFAEIFARYDGDFYKIDPHLFSPARVTLVNVDSGRHFTAGELRDDLVRQSFSN